MDNVPPNNIYPSDTPPEDYRDVLIRCGCCKVFVAVCSPVNDFYSVAGYPYLVCLRCMMILHDRRKAETK